MQVKYEKCSSDECQNKLACYKITRCLVNLAFRLHQSNRHLSPALAAVASPASVREEAQQGAHQQDEPLSFNLEDSLLNEIEIASAIQVAQNLPNTSSFFESNQFQVLKRIQSKQEDDINYQKRSRIDDDDDEKTNDSEFEVVPSDTTCEINETLLSMDKINLNDSISSDDSSFVKLEQQDDDSNRRRIWKMGVLIIYKANEGSHWFEYNLASDEIEHTFKEILRRGDQVILLDIERPSFYVRTKANCIYFGDSPTKIDKKFNDGDWIELTAWKEFGREVYYRRVDEHSWEKWVDGVRESDGSYDVMRIEGDTVVLRKNNLFYKLTWRDLSSSNKMSNWRKLCDGSYSSLDFIRL